MRLRRAAPLSALGLCGCLLLVNKDGAWPCQTQADCEGAATCVALGGRPSACYPPGWCVVDSDCDNRVGYGGRCSAGTCECAAGLTSCNGTCLDTRQETTNCGACGHICPDQASCVGSACQCPSGWGDCSGTCVDFAIDLEHCGGCDVQCAARGQQCTGGACACPGGQTVCGEACVDPQSDPSNCGACGATCSTPGQTCKAGACTCPSSEVACPGGCADLQSDTSNCGSCGATCAGTCTAGRCLVTLVTEATSPGGIAVDGANLYWTVTGDGTVKKLAKAGGMPTVLASGQGQPMSLAIDSANVYWANYSSGEVMQLPIAGGGSITLASGQTKPTAVVVGSSQVFWWSNDDSANGTSQLMAAPIGGGTVATWEANLSYTWGLAASGTTVYWTAAGALFSTTTQGAKAGGGFAANLPCAIQSRGTSIYWTNSSSTTAVDSATASASTLQSLATGPANVYRQSLAVDDTSVYWASSDGTIMKVALSGGTPVLLVTQQEDTVNYQYDMQRLAIDDTSVYWTNATANTVMKLTPK